MSRTAKTILAVVLLLVVVAAAAFAYYQWGPPAQKRAAEAQREALAAEAQPKEDGAPAEAEKTEESAQSDAAEESGKTEETPETAEETAETPEATAEATEEKTGAITITVVVVHSDGSEKEFVIHTDALTLREALDQEALIEGEMRGNFFMVLTVDGETADYNVDNAYWAMLQDGEWMMTGVDDTVIRDGDHYEFVYTPA